MAEAAKKEGGLGHLVLGLFNPSSRGISLPAVFSQEARDANRSEWEWMAKGREILARKQEQDMAASLADQVRGIAESFQESPTDTQQAGMRNAYESLGFTDEMLAPLARGATESRHAARRAGKGAGLLPEVANVGDVQSAQQAGQTEFSGRTQRDVNTQQADLTRETDRLQADLTRETDRQRQERTFTNQGEMARYKATLDVWKDKQTKGQQPDPYPVLAGLYESGAFKANPQVEQMVGFHVYNPTDRESASKLLNDLQQNAAKPETTKGGGLAARRDAATLETLARLRDDGKITPDAMPYADAALASGDAEAARKLIAPPTTRTTGTERSGFRSVKTLKGMLNEGIVPEQLRRSARIAVRKGDGRAAYSIVEASNRAVAPSSGNYVPAARDFVANNPDFVRLTPELQDTVKRIAVSGDQASAKIIMPKLLTRDMDAAEKLNANPQFRELAETAVSYDRLAAKLSDVSLVATNPDNPAMLDDSLFSPSMAAFIPTDPRWQGIAMNFLGSKGERKQALISKAEDLQSEIALAKTGKVANQTEQNRLRIIGPNGNEPSAALFAAKMRATDEMFARQRQISQREAEALAAGLLAGSPAEVVAKTFAASFQAEYKDNLRKYMNDLEGVVIDPDLMPDVELTPEQRAVMGGQ